MIICMFATVLICCMAMTLASCGKNEKPVSKEQQMNGEQKLETTYGEQQPEENAASDSEDKTASGEQQPEENAASDSETSKGQLLEVYDVQGSVGKARLTVDGKVLFTTKAYVGKNGLGKTGEGDNKTPVGTLHVLNAFGVKPNPGTTIPYIKVTPSVFACDENCQYYNKIIDTDVVHHKCKGEDMYHIVPQYNYGLATDFNEACVYPKGSNIFIHVKGSRPYTAGCIAIDEEHMVEILTHCDQSLVISIRK